MWLRLSSQCDLHYVLQEKEIPTLPQTTMEDIQRANESDDVSDPLPQPKNTTTNKAIGLSEMGSEATEEEEDTLEALDDMQVCGSSSLTHAWQHAGPVVPLHVLCIVRTLPAKRQEQRLCSRSLSEQWLWTPPWLWRRQQRMPGWRRRAAPARPSWTLQAWPPSLTMALRALLTWPQPRQAASSLKPRRANLLLLSKTQRWAASKPAARFQEL